MTCAFCKYNWCWVCNGEGTPSHWHPLNPFGCGAMMMEKNPMPSWFRVLLKCIVYLIFVFILPMLLTFGFPCFFGAFLR